MPPLRVLLVEDDFLIRACLADCLEERGISVREAGSVAEAREAIETADGFDLLLADMNLPDGLGTEVVALVRLAAPDLPVIHLSGSPVGTGPDTARERFLAKPYSLAAVIAALEEMTGRAILPEKEA